MSSFQEDLKILERMIDSGKTPPNRTPSFGGIPQERVIGFAPQASSPPPQQLSTSMTAPISIPGGRAAALPKESPPIIQLDAKMSTSVPTDFMAYKSQLAGWSESSASPSPPKMSPLGQGFFKIPKEPVKKITPSTTPTSSLIINQFSSAPTSTTTTPTTTPPHTPQLEPKRTPPQDAIRPSTADALLQKQSGESAQKPAAGSAKGAGKKQQQPQQGQKKPQQAPKKEAAKQDDKEKPAQQRKSGGPAPAPMQYDDPKRRSQLEKKKIVQQAPVAPTHQVALFSHLPQYEKGHALSAKAEIHPAIVSLGLMYANFKIAGSNARAVAMLTAFKQVIEEFETPPAKTFHRELDLKMKPLIQYLVDCRPISISMGNAINYFKQQLAQTVNLSESEAKEFLLERVDTFIQERIILADQVIAGFGVSKITNGDVILTFARSTVVESILLKAHEEGKKFRVIVVDSRPKFEGRQLLHSLSSQGIECTYITLTAISYIMKEVTKVFVGAYSMLSNGTLVSRVGTAVVAAMAHSYNIPVIVCCETYKFSERVLLDSICFNQLGDPDELHTSGVGSNFGTTKLSEWRSVDQLKLLNLMYDVTPMQYIVMVITEVGLIPPTSVPVILREYRKEPML